jgi:hypothetical protein
MMGMGGHGFSAFLERRFEAIPYSLSLRYKVVVAIPSFSAARDILWSHCSTAARIAAFFLCRRGMMSGFDGPFVVIAVGTFRPVRGRELRDAAPTRVCPSRHLRAQIFVIALLQWKWLKAFR